MSKYFEVAKIIKEAYDKLRRQGVQVPERILIPFGIIKSACGWYDNERKQIVVGPHVEFCNPITTLLHEIRHYQQDLATWSKPSGRRKRRNHGIDVRLKWMPSIGLVKA